jgi:RecA/RadA recombinase
MARKASKSLTAAVSAEIKSKFDLSNFKDKKGLSGNVKFKPQQWVPLSNAFQEVTSVPGIPTGHIVLLRGHSDTGKTTALIEAAVSAQKSGILPVFIVTEMKWNWEHAMQMGLDVEEIFDEETGELVDYQGNFIYADRETIHTIEDVAAFILDLLDEQKKGNLPYDLMFLWDSIGSVPCEMSIKSNKNNNEWNAGAMSTQFGNNVNQKITLSRKESSPYTNTLVAINKVWTAKPEMPMGKPKLMNKGGFVMWFDATFVVTFGNIANAGTSKIKAIKDKKQVEFAKRTNLQIDKNHINGITTRGKIIMTPHGFIEDTEKELKKYKDDHTAEWSKILGGGDFDIIEEVYEEPSPEMFTEQEPN